MGKSHADCADDADFSTPLYGYTFLSQLLIATETYGFHHKALIILSENNLYQEIYL